MTGEPALSVPAGFTGDGLPIGLQIAGPMGTEERLLEIGAALEEKLRLFERRPPILGAD